MEQELLTKLLQMTEETNRTVNIMAGAIITMQQDISGLKDDVAGLKQEVAELKQDVAELKQDVAELKQDVAELKQDVAILKEDVKELKAGQARLEQQIKDTNEKMDKEIADAVKDHKFILNNLSHVITYLHLDIISEKN